MRLEDSALKKMARAERRIQEALERARSDASFLAAKWPKRKSFWGGADVAIVDRPPEPPSEAQAAARFYPDPQYAATPHARVVSGAFVVVTDASRGVADYMTKYDLYASLARAVVDYHREHGDGTAEGVASAVLQAALDTFERWRDSGADFEPIVVHGEPEED